MHIHRVLVMAAVLALPAAPGCLPAQRTSTLPAPGRAAIALDSTFLTTGADTVVMLMEHDGDTLNEGIAVLERRIDPANRRMVYIQRLVIPEVPPITADSMHLHWPSLIPISAHTRGDSPRDFHFGPAGVRITSLRDSSTQEVALDSPVFLQRGVLLLLRALPLAEGYQAVLTVLGDSPEAGEMWISVRGAETVRTLDGGTCHSWVVKVNEPGMTGTYHVSTATRSLVRVQTEYGGLIRPTGCP